MKKATGRTTMVMVVSLLDRIRVRVSNHIYDARVAPHVWNHVSVRVWERIEERVWGHVGVHVWASIQDCVAAGLTGVRWGK